MPAPTWPHKAVEEGRLATGRLQARVGIDNGSDLPFAPKMVLLTAATAFTVTLVDGTTFTYGTGDLAPNMWHPCVCVAITGNDDAEILIQA